jgi:hypothetical protein
MIVDKVMDIAEKLLPFSIDELIADILNFLGLDKIISLISDAIPDLSAFTSWLDDLTGFLDKLFNDLTATLENMVNSIRDYLDNIV